MLLLICNVNNKRLGIVTLTFCIISGFKISNFKKEIPIRFPEYDIEISSQLTIGDTLKYNFSNIEDFKFVFYNTKGKCYCERYLNAKLYQRGWYENTLDTLKAYRSGRFPDGARSKKVLYEYFQPLKNGIWYNMNLEKK